MGERQKPSEEHVAQMLGEVGANAYEMADGWVRFLLDHDIAAGRASDVAMRALIEFLVGRERRHKDDFWPEDAHEGWTVDPVEVEHLRERMDWIDKGQEHMSLRRVEPYRSHPQRWSDTVAQVLRLVRRYTDEISDHPAHARIAIPVANAEARLARLPRRRRRPSLALRCRRLSVRRGIDHSIVTR